MALVTATDLKVYMDISLTNRQMDAADIVLAGLQSELEMFLRRPIEVTEYEEVHVIPSTHTGIPATSLFVNYSPTSESFYGSGSTVDKTTYLEPPTTIYLLNTPVVSVSEVKHKAYLTSTERTLVPEQDYVVRGFGIDVFGAYADDTVTVTYEGGLDGANIPVFKLMILRAATREMQNMHDDVVGVKDLETRNVAPLQTGFLETELTALKRYRKNRIS
jgi:hypothetical protein